MWPIESNYSFNVYEKPKPQSTGSAQDARKVSAQIASMSLHAASVDAQDGGENQCDICGDHHEPGEISRECETGDGF
jgi:hypothetical protein